MRLLNIPITALRGFILPQSFENPINCLIDYFLRWFRLRKANKIIRLKNGPYFKIKTPSDYLLIKEIFDEEYGKIDNKSIVIDIGAHKGVFSIFACQNAKKVYSYEPSSENFSVLKENIRLNNIKNIFPKHIAVCGKKGMLKLYLSKSALGHSAYIKTNKTDKFEEVKCLGLDDIFRENKIKKCDFLKVDCEGAEFDIFFNASDKTFKKINKMIIEVHPYKNHTHKDLVHLLFTKRFKIKTKKIGSYVHIFAGK